MRVILGREILPLIGHLIVRKNCLNRALRNARSTVDALLGVDEELILPFINAINRAYVDTRLVFLFDTRLGDDICHVRENTGAMGAEQSIFTWARSTLSPSVTKGQHLSVRTARPH